MSSKLLSTQPKYTFSDVTGSLRQSPDYLRGLRDAATVADEYNGVSLHKFRLGDCILGKLNVGRVKPRKNNRRVLDQDAWFRGFAVALAEMHRQLLGGNDSSSVCRVAREAGLTIKVAKVAGCLSFDWLELKRAGVK